MSANTRRRFHENYLMQITMEKGVLNVQLMNEPVTGTSNSKEAMQNDEFGSRRKGFMIIDALNLSVSFSNKSSLVPLNCAIRVVFNFINPFANNGFVTYRQWITMYCFAAKLLILHSWQWDQG
ncbi:hypothetical protein C1H46_040565 [Malus baccata]|uniref:Uncharacterized protein n=1 Tax=Malus baccata TaxID=106549 RepID=A0A540KI54_MALBA|nr:hypothetical protein C1H46_040565 [Malus baccata]